MTNEYGETSNVVTGITYADKSDEYDVFYIKELNTSNDQRYNLLDAELNF